MERIKPQKNPDFDNEKGQERLKFRLEILKRTSPSEYSRRYEGFIKGAVKAVYENENPTELAVNHEEAFSYDEGNQDIFFYVINSKTGTLYAVGANFADDGTLQDYTCGKLY